MYQRGLALVKDSAIRKLLLASVTVIIVYRNAINPLEQEGSEVPPFGCQQ